MLFDRDLSSSSTWKLDTLLLFSHSDADLLPVCTLWQRSALLGTRSSSSTATNHLWFTPKSVTLVMKFFPWSNFNIIFLIGSVRFDLTDFDSCTTLFQTPVPFP